MPRAAISTEQVEQAALRYLAQRDRTSAQVARHLDRKGASQAQVRSVLRRLTKAGYLNDRAFAARWAEARLARRPMGREALKAELLRQGLSEGLVVRTLDTFYQRGRERELAEQVIRQAARRTPVSSSRAARLLRQRGFDEETIDEVVPSEDRNGV
ncbi:MAG TPA: RecX family transcriptional regulator [Nitrospiraceae bacterium]|jgi:regulatory protein|nr:RecX family transcriptional regulator [Nitrospiraceae bacterium]